MELCLIIVTTKKLAWKSVTSELLWFLEGSNDERRLAEILYEKDRDDIKNKKTIWTQNANAEYWKDKAKFFGDVGRIYGVQWRDFNGVDQIKNLIFKKLFLIEKGFVDQHKNCNSHQDYKGIYDNKSTGVFNGKIIVEKQAQKTNAFQSNNNVLLSDKATINAKRNSRAK